MFCIIIFCVKPNISINTGCFYIAMVMIPRNVTAYLGKHTKTYSITVVECFYRVFLFTFQREFKSIILQVLHIINPDTFSNGKPGKRFFFGFMHKSMVMLHGTRPNSSINVKYMG